ncbi:ADP-heptose--LPS heptosyltransferase 2 [Kluyvera cryocrescens]|uniref:ADP-heptose--LPS heptosyltransferase 2 n=1 Tax=Kluyvera cryocrescens TaxID=580 RepID=A0A485AYP2_KLUCR|nr:ADP-heptose--LPS heptosyltransferase 2 [Kluyvera cryocrescens]
MPEVNEAIAMPLGHGALEIGERRKLGHSLRERRYDRAYVLPNSFKSALVPFFAGIPLRTGWRGRNALRSVERRGAYWTKKPGC